MLYSPSKSENWSVAAAMTQRTTKHVVTVSTRIGILKILRGFDLLQHSVKAGGNDSMALSI